MELLQGSPPRMHMECDIRNAVNKQVKRRKGIKEKCSSSIKQMSISSISIRKMNASSGASSMGWLCFLKRSRQRGCRGDGWSWCDMRFKAGRQASSDRGK